MSRRRKGDSTAVMARRHREGGGMSARPEGAGAVMAGRAPAGVEGDDARQALHRTLDYFPTPPWAARAGADLIQRIDPGARTLWEPACGEGHMAAPLAERFTVFASDVHPFGYGQQLDFLSDEAGALTADWIVTNPPFAIAGEFARLGLDRARRGVALLLRLQFLEGIARQPLLFGDRPLTVCAVFAERVPMTLGRWDTRAASATAYAWFLWYKNERRLNGDRLAPRLQSIPPGTRHRLWHPDDARRFGWKSEAGLLDAMEVAE